MMLGTIYVTSIKLVLEAAVDDELGFIKVVICAVHDIDQCILGYAWQAIRLVFRNEVRELRFVRFININNGLQSGARKVVLFTLHDIAGVLEHAR